MKKKSAIIITIGEQGTIFTIHDSKGIANKIFFEDFDNKVKETLKEILSKNKSHNIYILLDTLDQSFKKKNFPLVKKGDLKLLINREIDNDTEKDSLKNYIILEKIENEHINNSVKNWQILFISSSISKDTQDFLNFLHELPNQIIGIYLSAIESVNLINSINKFDNKEPDKLESRIDCLITQTKVSNLRQTIYHKNQILFTRLLDYTSLDPDFLRKYEKDLYASFDYLKRLFPEISITKFYITNILSKKSNDLISKITNIEFKIKSYTPFQLGRMVDNKFVINENSKDSDLIISRSFFHAKRESLKFVTKEIATTQKTYFFMKFSYFMNLVILLMIGILSVSSVSKISESEEMINVVKIKKLNYLNELSYTKKKLSNKEKEIGEKYKIQTSADKIIEIGQISEIFDKMQDVSFKEYVKLKFLKKHNVEIKNISYKLINFKPSNANSKKYVILIDAQMINKSGDIDDLFIKYDELKARLSKEYSKYKFSINDLPKNINLAEKYHFFNVQIKINNK